MSRLFLRNLVALTPRSIPMASFCSRALNADVGGVSMVQGASRGIGLEFNALETVLDMSSRMKFFLTLAAPSDNLTDDSLLIDLLYRNSKQLLERYEKGRVIATCRNPSGAVNLLELKQKFGERLDILPLDVTVESTIEASATVIQERYGSLNLLLNASGVLSIPNVLQPETTLSKVQKSSLLLCYEINAVGPILVTKVGGGSGTQRDVAIVANLSARVGSIVDNCLGGWHSYRSSKAALNQLTKTVSLEFARKKDPIICILLHPGTVDTDLSKPFQRNVSEGKLFTKEFSVQKLLGIINNVKSSDNGKFFAWDGQEIPW